MNDLVTPFISGAFTVCTHLLLMLHRLTTFRCSFLVELFDGDASLCNLEGLSACKLFDVETVLLVSLQGA